MPKRKRSTSLVPGRKRRRSPRCHRPPLLTLDDDTLKIVLAEVMGDRQKLPDGTPRMLRGPNFKRAFFAFPLALSCKRMLRNFTETVLARIDAAQIPHHLDPAYLGKFNWSWYQKVKILSQFIRLSGESLQELHIPPYRQIKVSVEPVIEAVATHCPNVKTLSYQDTDVMPLVPVRTLEMLFKGMAGSLLSLSIGSPSIQTLKALRNNVGCCLRKVELTAVDPSTRTMEALMNLIEADGCSLESLSIMFDVLDHYPTNRVRSRRGNREPSARGIRAFRHFLGTKLMVCCPLLESFEIGIWQCSPPHPSQIDQMQDSRYLCDEKVAAACTYLLEQGTCQSDTKPRLKYMRVVTGDEGNCIMEHIADLSALIGANTHVELELPGACVVVPTENCGVKQPFYKSLRLTKLGYITKALERNEKVFDKTERIVLGKHFFDEMQDTHHLAAVQTLFSKAGPSLKSFRVELFQLFVQPMHVMCFNALLFQLQTVTSLDVSRELVIFAHAQGPMHRKQLLGAMLTNLKTLRLTESVEFRRIEREMNHFVIRFLPEFLSMVEENCPCIEGIYLDHVSMDTSQRPEPEHWANLYRATAATLVFNVSCPNCDVSTVMSQLQTWKDTLEKAALLNIA